MILVKTPLVRLTESLFPATMCAKQVNPMQIWHQDI